MKLSSHAMPDDVFEANIASITTQSVTDSTIELDFNALDLEISKARSLRMIELIQNASIPLKWIINMRHARENISETCSLLAQAFYSNKIKASLMLDFSDESDNTADENNETFRNPWKRAAFFMQNAQFHPGQTLEINLSENFIASNTEKQLHALFDNLHRAPTGFELNLNFCFLEGASLWSRLVRALQEGLVPVGFKLLVKGNIISKESFADLVKAINSPRLSQGCQIDLGSLTLIPQSQLKALADAPKSIQSLGSQLFFTSTTISNQCLRKIQERPVKQAIAHHIWCCIFLSKIKTKQNAIYPTDLIIHIMSFLVHDQALMHINFLRPEKRSQPAKCTLLKMTNDGMEQYVLPRLPTLENGDREHRVNPQIEALLEEGIGVRTSRFIKDYEHRIWFNRRAVPVIIGATVIGFAVASNLPVLSLALFALALALILYTAKLHCYRVENPMDITRPGVVDQRQL